VNPAKTLFAGDTSEEISALIATLHETGQRLEELTAGEVDTVANRDGQTFVLRHAQEQLRHVDEAKQAAILNALPAHVALLDVHGVILSVNEAWRRFGAANVIQRPGYAVGLNYLEICDGAQGDGASQARQIAEGIRSVLAGALKSFSIEYPCHSKTEQVWFLLSATPLAEEHPSGAVVMHLNITAQKRAEQEQREVSQLLDNIVDNIPTAVQLKSVQDGLRILMWNKAAEAMYGLARGEAIGRNVRELWPEADADRMHASDLELVANGGMQDFPDRPAQTRNRGAIRVHMRKVALSDASGKATHLLVIADDISSRLADQARLRESEARFRSLTGLSADWYWEQDEDCRFIRFSGGDQDGGWGKDQLNTLGLHRWELPGIVPVSGGWNEHKALLEARSPFRNFEYHRVVGPGQLQYVAVSGEPVFDVGGTFKGYRGIATDITERKRASQELLESELRFRQLAENIREVFWLTDPAKNQILYVSSAYAEIWGRSVQNLYASPHDWMDAIHPEDRGRVLHAAQTKQASGEYAEEYRIVRPDGAVRWIRDRAFPVLRDDGEVYRIAGLAEDITERKTADEILKKRATELERFHRLSVGREMQMIELKKEINERAAQAGQKPPYDLAFLGPQAVKTGPGHEPTS
jgi:PAS domain S-box-containing protein